MLFLCFHSTYNISGGEGAQKSSLALTKSTRGSQEALCYPNCLTQYISLLAYASHYQCPSSYFTVLLLIIRCYFVQMMLNIYYQMEKLFYPQILQSDDSINIIAGPTVYLLCFSMYFSIMYFSNIQTQGKITGFHRNTLE